MQEGFDPGLALVPSLRLLLALLLPYQGKLLRKSGKWVERNTY